MNRTLTPELLQKIKGVELLILDVDGVLTNGQIYYGSNGIELKAFSAQ
ncbi:MAG TPA: HAD family hydrolase, partial [Gammaproteobacteria bacterium]|nr:HAD family hydrolase [Gammaproteobacteria bacterium]